MDRAIDKVVGPRGFSRHGTRWYRPVAESELTQLIVRLTSKSGASVAVWLGIFDPTVADLVWQQRPKTVTEIDCVVRTELAMLMGTKGLWDRTSTVDAEDAAAGLVQVGLPWLDSMREPKAWVAELRSQPGRIDLEDAYLAIAEARVGDQDAARTRWLKLRDTAEGRWSERLERIGEAYHLDR